MSKNFTKHLLLISLLLVWAFLLFVQHVGTIVIFGPVTWDMYLLIIVSYIPQLLILMLFKKKLFSRTVAIICHYLYVAGLTLTLGMVLMLLGDESVGLCIVCAIADIFGIMQTVLMKNKKTGTNTGDGTVY